MYIVILYYRLKTLALTALGYGKLGMAADKQCYIKPLLPWEKFGTYVYSQGVNMTLSYSQQLSCRAGILEGPPLNYRHIPKRRGSPLITCRAIQLVHSLRVNPHNE